MGGFHAGHDHGATLMADIDDTEQVLGEMEGWRTLGTAVCCSGL